MFANKSADVALRFGTIGSAVIFIVAAYFVITSMGASAGVWGAVLVGAIGGIIVGLVTDITLAARRSVKSPRMARRALPQ